MKTWTAIATLALLLQTASAGYDGDWDGGGVVSTSNDIKQSYGGNAGVVAAPLAEVVMAPLKASGGGDDDDDGDDGAASAPVPAPVAAPESAAPAAAPPTDAPSPVVTPAPVYAATTGDDEDDDTDDAPAAPAAAPESAAAAPEPVYAATSDDDNDEDEDEDDGDDDGDDDVAPTIYQGRPYEQNDNYSGGKQSTVAPQTQTDQTGVDSRPNVNNGGVNLYPYTQELRDYIVATHNYARGHLPPSQAANMRQLSWDESLAIEASELVNTCVFEHDTENYAYGQNLMYGGYSLDKQMIDGWMDGWVKNELSEYDRAGTGFMDLDHASAVLWANSYLVGCASKLCPKGYLSACNYYTPGNWQGEQAYISGPSCSQCPAKAPYCDASGKLCTADPNGATPTTKPNPAQNPAQGAVTPAAAPAATPAKTTPAAAAVPKATPAKTTPGSAKAPAPTPKLTIPHELCV